MDVQQAHQKGEFAPLVIGFCNPGTVDAEFCLSLTDTLIHDSQSQQLVCGPGGGVIGIQSSPRIAEARSKIVDEFLNSPTFVDLKGFRADWLLMVDADMQFTGEDVYALLASADPIDKPIVGGLCFSGAHSGVLFPTLYTLTREDDGSVTIGIAENYTPGEMHQVGGTGAAFLLVHRSVYVKMAKMYQFLPNGVRNPFPWFVEGHIDSKGNGLGEDISFCMRAQACGFPVFVNTNVRIGHMKRMNLNEKVFNERNRRPVH